MTPPLFWASTLFLAFLYIMAFHSDARAESFILQPPEPAIQNSEQGIEIVPTPYRACFQKIIRPLSGNHEVPESVGHMIIPSTEFFQTGFRTDENWEMARAFGLRVAGTIDRYLDQNISAFEELMRCIPDSMEPEDLPSGCERYRGLLLTAIPNTIARMRLALALSLPAHDKDPSWFSLRPEFALNEDLQTVPWMPLPRNWAPLTETERQQTRQVLRFSAQEGVDRYISNLRQRIAEYESSGISAGRAVHHARNELVWLESHTLSEIIIQVEGSGNSELRAILQRQISQMRLEATAELIRAINRYPFIAFFDSERVNGPGLRQAFLRAIEHAHHEKQENQDFMTVLRDSRIRLIEDEQSSYLSSQMPDPETYLHMDMFYHLLNYQIVIEEVLQVFSAFCPIATAITLHQQNANNRELIAIAPLIVAAFITPLSLSLPAFTGISAFYISDAQREFQLKFDAALSSPNSNLQLIPYEEAVFSARRLTDEWVLLPGVFFGVPLARMATQQWARHTNIFRRIRIPLNR